MKLLGDGSESADTTTLDFEFLAGLSSFLTGAIKCSMDVTRKLTASGSSDDAMRPNCDTRGSQSSFGLGCFTPDLLKKVRASTEEERVRELPDVGIRAGPLGTRRTVELVEAVHVQLANEGGEVGMLEVRAEDSPTEFSNVGDNKAEASSQLCTTCYIRLYLPGSVLSPLDVLCRLGVDNHPV